MTEGNKIFLLTNDSASKRAYLDILQSEYLAKHLGVVSRELAARAILTLNEHVSKYAKIRPELANYEGFLDEAMSDADFMSQNDEAMQRGSIYDPHLSFEDQVIGIKEGKFFQGRFNVSRLVATEALVKVGGLSQEILIKDPEHQNRALSGDIVCVELLPQAEWVANFKKADKVFDVALEDEGDGDAISIDDESDGEKAVNLIDLVNNEQTLQVTGRIRGVLKKLNKTYGGSVLQLCDMLPSTKAKLEKFFENCAIAAEKRNNYRVFVPYNTQVPQAIMRMRDPSALEKKRIIIRFQDWPENSPFPIGHFVRIVGEEGVLATETNMILHEFSVDCRPFSQRVLNCLPKEGRDW